MGLFIAYCRSSLKIYHKCNASIYSRLIYSIHELNIICRTCAYECEKSHELAAAALAYKCVEVAYLRVVYCKSSTTCRVWQDLQSSLQLVPQGLLILFFLGRLNAAFNCSETNVNDALIFSSSSSYILWL